MKKSNIKKFDVKGFVVKFEDLGRFEFCIPGKYRDTDSDIRCAKVFKTEKAAQKFAARFVKKEKCLICDGFGCQSCNARGVEPVQDSRYSVAIISDFVGFGYAEKNGKVVKEKCFVVKNEFYTLSAEKYRGSHYNVYKVYKTAKECMKESAKEMKDGIKEIKGEIKDLQQSIKKKMLELKEMEKELKKLLKSKAVV